MPIFVRIVTYDLGKVFFRTFWSYFVKDYIISVSKSIRTWVFLFIFLILKPLFKLFLSLFGALYIAKRIIYWLKVLGIWLRLFNSKVFYNNAQGLYLGCSNVSRTITLLSLVVYLLTIENRLKVCFAIIFDCFLDYPFSSI